MQIELNAGGYPKGLRNANDGITYFGSDEGYSKVINFS